MCIHSPIFFLFFILYELRNIIDVKGSMKKMSRIHFHKGFLYLFSSTPYMKGLVLVPKWILAAHVICFQHVDQWTWFFYFIFSFFIAIKYGVYKGLDSICSHYLPLMAKWVKKGESGYRMKLPNCISFLLFSFSYKLEKVVTMQCKLHSLFRSKVCSFKNINRESYA